MTADATAPRPSPRSARLAPRMVDYVLAIAAVLLLAVVLVALARGAPHWGSVPAAVWLHLFTVVGALALSPIMLLRCRGDTLHRALGWLWVVLSMATAIVSFDIRGHGRLSPIHILSAFVLVQTPMIVWYARSHNVRGHSIAVRSTVACALLIAGFFTLPFGRMLGTWLFGG